MFLASRNLKRQGFGPRLIKDVAQQAQHFILPASAEELSSSASAGYPLTGIGEIRRSRLFSRHLKVYSRLKSVFSAKADKAQVTLEFTFCFIIIIILLLACFSAFLWAGRTFVERQKAFDSTSNSFSGSSSWVDFYQPQDMNLVPTINRE